MMTNETLLRLLPPVVRARDFRLYTQDGRRLTDLWQNNGAAVLGHTHTGMLRELKNAAERGLYAPLPHSQERRFLKALAALLPGMSFRLYSGAAPLLRAAGTDRFPDPALEDMPPPPEPALWRPFLDSAAPADRPLVPVLPQPWPAALSVLALPPSPAETALAPPDSQLIPPTILAAATRGVYNLIAAKTTRGRLPYPRVEKALAEKKWQRRGIYLCRNAVMDDEAWAALFRLFLEQGFLLPPVQAHPLILPGALSPGEEAKLAGLLKE
ncbi:MAG: hypothetical protein LBK63_00630 [Treponema sp.]|jgi:hypothetical protein|nr:hypothetical protein [Treponema sp.]